MLGLGCISKEQSDTTDSTGQTCSNLPCASDLNLECINCGTGSCLLSLKSLRFLCLPLITPITSCISPYKKYRQKCCFHECSDCDELIPYKCLSCIAENSSPDPIFGCICNNLFSNNFPLTSQTSCTYTGPCPDVFSTCTHSKCLQCKALNSSPNSLYSCTCDSGFYESGPLTLPTSCSKCPSQCQTCTSSSNCLNCKALNSSPNDSNICTCNSKFYQKYSIDQIDACQDWHPDCLTCNNSKTCIQCIDSNSEPEVTQGCLCKVGYWKQKNMKTC